MSSYKPYKGNLSDPRAKNAYSAWNSKAKLFRKKNKAVLDSRVFIIFVYSILKRLFYFCTRYYNISLKLLLLLAH